MLTLCFKLMRSLHARFLLALLLTGIIPLGLVGLTIALLESRVISQQSARELTGLARGLGGQIEFFLNGALQDTRAITALPEIVSMDPRRQGPLLKELFHHHSEYARLSTFDRTGRRLASSHPGGAPSIGMRSSFQAALRSGHQRWEIAHALSTGRSSFLVHTPIRDADRRVIGALGAVVDLQNLSAILNNVRVGGGGQTFVLDVDGRVLLHPDLAAVQERRDYSSLGVPAGGRPAGAGTIKYERDGEAFTAGYAAVSTIGWTVVVEQPEMEILLPAKRSLQLALSGLIISTFLALVTGVFFTREITRPVSELADAARALAAGDPSVSVPRVTPDQGEVATLVEAFDAMREEVQAREKDLQARYKEFQTLHEIGQSILSSLDLNATLEVILAKTLSVGSFDLGVIRLLDPSGETLRPVVSRGFLEPGNIRVHGVRDTSRGESVARVLELKQAWVIENVAAAGGLRTLKREGVQSAIIIPILADKLVLGLFHFGSRTPRRFEPNEVRLLEAIGNLMGIAVQKARLLEETKQNLEVVHALRDIDAAITSTLDLQTVLTALLERINSLFPYFTTVVRFLDSKTGELDTIACRGLDKTAWESHLRKIRIPGMITKQALETRAPVIVANGQTDARIQYRAFFQQNDLFSLLEIPLLIKDEALGVISFYTKEEREFSKDEVEFLTTLAGQAAVAIHNSQLYEEMTKLAADLAKSNRVKDEFLSVMSHELRTPLNVIMGYAGMIGDGMFGEVNCEQRKAAERILGRAKEQLTMISGILQVTQIEAERVKLERDEVHLADFLDDLKSGYQVSLDRAVTVRWDYFADLPVVRTDSDKLKHILQNLINNAIKFTEKGSVTVSARIKEEATGMSQQFIEVKVADTGIGIPEEALPFIFEKFRQLDSSETRAYGGVGMGLYIVNKYVELLGGKVEVESEVGKGSMFTVKIPCEIEPAAEKGTGLQSRQSVADSRESRTETVTAEKN